MMAAGNPNRWSLSSSTTDNKAHQQPSAILPPCPSLFPQFVAAGSSNSLPLNSLSDHNNQEFPHSWNQLLMGGLASEEAEKFGQFESKKLENWEEEEQQQILNINQSLLRAPVFDNHVKQKEAQSRQLYGSDGDDDHDGFQTSISNTRIPNSWSSSVTTTLSTTTTTTTNILDFSNNKGSDGRNQHTDHSSECNSISSGGVSKRAKVHSSSTQPPLKVRKEKLGDRITALHQLVSPFGKTDTASVLLEAIGYIGFLQAQIEALSSPYLGNASANMRHRQSVIHGERGSTFPEDHGQGNEDAPKDLSSRGLCLVPLSCTEHVGSENIGADYWAPALGGGF